MQSIYQERILQHSTHPHNFGRLQTATGKVLLENPLCGDVIQMEAEIKNGIVNNIKFTGRGCAISKAAASLLTDKAIGRQVAELQNWDKTSIINLLGIELGPNRLKCALLPLEAMHTLLAKVNTKNL